jgi:hypothetical protein
MSLSLIHAEQAPPIPSGGKPCIEEVESRKSDHESLVRLDKFDLQTSTFNFQLSTFNFQLSTFNFRLPAFLINTSSSASICVHTWLKLTHLFILPIHPQRAEFSHVNT